MSIEMLKNIISNIIIYLIVISFISCKEKEIIPLELANQIVMKYEGHQSMSYEIDYRIKYFSDVDDTTKVSAKIDLIRQKEDSIFGGYVWIKSDSIERYYDTKNTYFINHKNDTITRYPIDKPYAITGNTIGESVKIYFLKPERLLNGAKDSTIKITISEDKINNIETWKIGYEFEDDEYSTNTWKNIWIEKQSSFISKMNFSSDMQGENQYNQWDLSNIKYDSYSISDLDKRFDDIKQNYTIVDFKERTKEEASLLSYGSQIPKLTGTQYTNKTEISLDDYNGEMILLDFWYMDCFPCIKAIPHLNDIFSKYKDKGLVVIGANPFDNNQKDLNRMPNFLATNPIDYPIMFIDKTKPKDFKIYAYPSFYLIGKNGEILHSEVGFSENSINKIDSLIQINI